MIEERYGSGATLITSQLPVSDWREYLGYAGLATTKADRQGTLLRYTHIKRQRHKSQTQLNPI